MTQNAGKVHVVRVSKTGYVDKQGRRRDYSSAYLRRTYREAGTVKNETVAKHLEHIYRKLGVSSRAAAVSRMTMPEAPEKPVSPDE